MKRFTYIRLHIPTGRRDICNATYAGQSLFMLDLNKWNRNQPGVWQYFAYDTVGTYDLSEHGEGAV